MWYGNTAGEEVYSEGSATPHTKEAEPERPKKCFENFNMCAHSIRNCNRILHGDCKENCFSPNTNADALSVCGN